MATRPHVYRAEGIVLRRRNIGEADSIFTVLATDGHRFEAVARGVRKARSRMRGHLEPLTHSRFQIAVGRNLDVFTQVESIASFPRLRDDLERTSAGLYCAELCERFSVEGQPIPGLFPLFKGILAGLEAGAPEFAVRYFEYHLLALTGFELQFSACAGCGRALPEEPALYSAITGGLVCRECRSGGEAGRLMSIRSIKTLRFAKSTNLPGFCNLQLDGALRAEIESALQEAIVLHLDRHPRTSRFMREVAALAGGTSPTAGDALT